MGSRRPPVVVHVVHSLEGGGTERTLVALLREFDHAAIRHVVVTLREAGALAAHLPEQVACIPLQGKGRSRTATFRLARVLARLQPDVVHARNVCTWGDAVPATIFLPRTKLVLGFHGLQSGAPFTRRDRITARLARVFGSSFTSVSLCGLKQMVEELGVPEERIRCLPNGVDLERFSDLRGDRVAMRQAIGFSEADRVLGIVGSLTPVKGHALLLSAFRAVVVQFPEARLVIVGDGAQRGSLESQANTIGLARHVKFLGEREDVPKVLAALDGVVCASYAEGMSNALMEGMAAGLPLVTTSVGDHGLLVRDGVDGLVVPPGDVQAMGKALRTLMTMPDRGVAMGQSARARIEACSLTRTVEAYERFYAGLASGEHLSSLKRRGDSRRFAGEVSPAFEPAFPGM